MTHELTSYNTKKALVDALKKAMRSKPFSRITVSELISACSINRKTFYYHFTDIFALLQWMLSEETVSVLEGFDLLSNYESAVRFVVEYVQANDHIISCAFDSIGREEMKRFFFNDGKAIVYNCLRAAAQQRQVSPDPAFLDFLAHYHTEALTGMLLEYARNIRTQDKEQTIQNLIWVIRSAIRSVADIEKS